MILAPLFPLPLSSVFLPRAPTPPDIPETYRTQVEEPWSEDPVIKRALKNTNTKLQSLSDVDGLTHYDEYSCMIDKMPLGVAPKELLAAMMKDLNGTVNNSNFDQYSDFNPRVNSKHPQIGDIVDISLGLGFELSPRVNGSVMLTEMTPSSFTYSTVTNINRSLWRDDSHPINGSREFGFELNSDGLIRFYTRAATKPHDTSGRLGAPFADQAWKEWNRGLVNTINQRGGIARPALERYKGYKWNANARGPREETEPTAFMSSLLSRPLSIRRLDEAFAKLQSLL